MAEEVSVVSLASTKRWSLGRCMAATLAAAALLLLTGAALTPTVPAYGWANGPDWGNGFGTHDWVLVEAGRLAAAHGYGWLRVNSVLKHTDDPDTVFHDTWYHVYDVWGAHWGDAPTKVAALYAKAVSQLRSGHKAAASKTVALLSHYYADICNPLHTDSCAAEDHMHSSYEDAVDDRTAWPGENRGWIHCDGIQKRSNAWKATANAAAFAHRSYHKLVSAYNRAGFNGTVLRITKRSLNKAVNGLADLIATIRMAAR